MEPVGHIVAAPKPDAPSRRKGITWRVHEKNPHAPLDILHDQIVGKVEEDQGFLNVFWTLVTVGGRGNERWQVLVR